MAKPDQRIFLAALDALHCPAQESWMIGDDLAFDIVGSQKLGTFAIWCDLAGHSLPEGTAVHPDRIIYEEEHFPVHKEIMGSRNIFVDLIILVQFAQVQSLLKLPLLTRCNVQ